MRPARLIALALAFLVAACGTSPPRDSAEPPRRGAYYKDDGPGENPPANLEAVPDAVPKREPLNGFANRPYEVFGKTYVPMVSVETFRQRGLASWYGRRYHGSNTSSGEPYDMYAMTAAHPTLPIPSYARVTSLLTGKIVVVRINDRGPFHSERIIDLSYTAASKLGLLAAGSAFVEIQSILPEANVELQKIPVELPAAQRDAPLKPAPAVAMKGIFLQLGAFAAEQNAETFRIRISRDLAWLSGTIQIRLVDGLFKLHLGPYRTQNEARGVAERIRVDLNVAPVLVLVN